MQFDSARTGIKQQGDGRLTIVLMLVFLLLLRSLIHNYCVNDNESLNQTNRSLCVTDEKRLYLGQDDDINRNPESMPISFFPFLFRPVPINSAEKELLMTIKGIGPAMADSIIAHRNRFGPILNTADLQKIPGIGEKRATTLAAELVFDKAK